MSPDHQKNEIEILIMGPIGSGKTTVARLIEQALKGTPIQVNVEDQAKKKMGLGWSAPISKEALNKRTVRVRTLDVG